MAAVDASVSSDGGQNISSDGGQDIIFESFGVRLRVTADAPEVIERIAAVLPPGARPCPASAVEESFRLLAEDGGSYRLERGDSPLVDRLDLELALAVLGSALRDYVGLHAPNRIFVQAGVVAHEGRAIVIPGLSLSGKTTLVLELVRAGAAYYSDEFAVLDERGLVHPYPTTPALREPVRPDKVEVERLPGDPGEEPLAIGAVVFTAYRSGARWKPARLSPGHGAVAMLAHALAKHERSQEAMRVIAKAIEGAVILEGDRGEAQELAPELLSATPTQSGAGRR